MRFESINRYPSNLSTNKRSGTHLSQLDRNLSGMVNPNVVKVGYQINEDLVTKKAKGIVSLGK